MREMQRALDPLLPPAVAHRAEEIGEAKANFPLLPLVGLGGLAGAFIAIGAQLFTVVTTETNFGFGADRLIGGVALPPGRVVVGVAGGGAVDGTTLVCVGR